MDTDGFSLHHIAVKTTDPEKVIAFYSNILGLFQSDPVDIQKRCPKKRDDPSSFPRASKNLLGNVRERLFSGYFTKQIRVSLAGTGGEEYEILFVLEIDETTGKGVPVSGNSIYGLGFLLRDDIDPEILAWDLEIAGIPFIIGDPYSCGLSDHGGNTPYSLFVKDPDGRIVELIPSPSPGTRVREEPLAESRSGIPLVSELSHVMIYVTDPAASSRYYEMNFGLKICNSSDSKTAGPGIMRISMKDAGSQIRLIFVQARDEDGQVIPAGGDGIDHIGLTGTIASSIELLTDPGCTIVSQRRDGEADTRVRKAGYCKDPDGYILEICSLT
ncbi:MAG: VOC family protein [Methanospirillaceae archaeon]|nr:VOC family protein [Methanospirillaceae archaeon]